jgi:hypothetical protein
MDLRTEQILKLFKSHLRIKNFLITLCYFMIIGGIFVYIFYAFNRSHTIKLVNQFSKNPKAYEMEKIMTNPRIKFQYNETQVYHIKAKKAFHKNEREAVMQDVFATGDIGNISAGKLEIDEEGNHLVFSQNPVLILNNTDTKLTIHTPN